MSLLAEGGLLALDWGQKRVGYATCDEEGLVVTPRGHFKRPKGAPVWRLTPSDEAQIQRLIKTWQPGGLLLGLPLNPGGAETSASEKARALAKILNSKYSLSVDLINESLTSWDSQDAADNDAQAAALLLQDFIEQRKRSLRGGFARGLVLFLCLFLAALGFYAKGFLLDAHSSRTEKYVIDIPPGTGFAQLFQQLQLSRHQKYLAKAWLKVKGLESSLKVGEFEVNPEWSVARALEHVLTSAPLYHTLTVREGENIYDIFKTFQGVYPKLSLEDFQALVREPKLILEMGIPAIDGHQPTLEGFLYPETYTYQKYHQPKDLIRHMLSQFEKIARPELLKHEWSKTPEGIYKLLILASVVEKESSVVEEQPVVASVFWNRIRKGMRLQSDPTTIYPLLPNFDGNLKRVHLETLNDYNTYRISGLPIGPISNPSVTAIRAVIAPANTSYLYFVSKNDGTHIFSEDYKTHAKYVQEYQISRRKNKSP